MKTHVLIAGSCSDQRGTRQATVSGVHCRLSEVTPVMADCEDLDVDQMWGK